MTDVLHLGCGDVHKPNAINVDYRRTDAVDEIVDLNQATWPWADNSMRLIIGEHVFEHLEDVENALRECARILKPDGRLRIVMPVGQNSWADPDHKHRWNWDTPEMYCGKRDWDKDVGLSVLEKDAYIRTHIDWPLNPLYGGFLRLWERWEGPGRWMFDMPATSGEFEVIFRNDCE